MKKYLLISYLLIFLDQLSKLFVLIYIQKPLFIISDIFSFVLKLNEGVAFSLPLFPSLIIPLLVCIIFGGTILSYFFIDWENKINGVSFSLIFAGAIGNLIDRIFHGKVIDFIKIGWWPVFNVADILIFLGTILVIYGILTEGKKSHQVARSKKRKK